MQQTTFTGQPHHAKEYFDCVGKIIRKRLQGGIWPCAAPAGGTPCGFRPMLALIGVSIYADRYIKGSFTDLVDIVVSDSKRAGCFGLKSDI